MSAKRSIDDGDAPVSVADGRWGRRRFLVAECEAVLPVESVYTDLLRVGKRLRPGVTVTGVATIGGRDFPVRVEVRPNRVWRSGRLFFVCGCGRRCTRLYLPAAALCVLACRRCYGLSYGSRTLRNYKDSGPIVFGVRLTHRMVARLQAARIRRERSVAARRRQVERGQLRTRLTP